MRHLVAVSLLTFLLVPVPAGAADYSCDADVHALGVLYEIRGLMLSPRVSSWDVTKRIDERLEEARESLPGGGYRWVDIVRPIGDGPVDRSEHLVQAAVGSPGADLFEASSAIPYAVKIVVPRKRSLFRGNERVWIESVSIRYVVDGETKTVEESMQRWMTPNSTRTFDLKDVTERADVVLEVATDPDKTGQALVEVHFAQGVPRDNPDNPRYLTVEVLKRLRYDLDPSSLDLEIGRVEQRLFPSARVLPLTTIVGRIREYQAALQSEEEKEKEQASKMLEEIVKALPK